jgi:hypothetical protein
MSLPKSGQTLAKGMPGHTLPICPFALQRAMGMGRAGAHGFPAHREVC